ncbi:MAG: hypothetical protein ACPHER_02515, partial [Nevskiales bacterium]
ARDEEMFTVASQRAQAVLPGLDSLEPLLWAMQAHVEYLLEHPDYLRMQLQQGYVWYHSASWPSSDEQYMWEQGLSLLEQVFGWGASAGYFVPGIPAEQSKMMMAMQQARLASWVANGMQESQETVINRIQVDFVRLFSLPRVAVKLLSKDGTELSETARQKINEIAAAA